MSYPASTPEEHFAVIVGEFLSNPAVTPPSGSGFGSSGLRVDGKIFAMLSSRGEYVVKLPRARVEALVAAGRGRLFGPGHGRRMREWLVVETTAAEDWLPLAREALAFVAPHR